MIRTILLLAGALFLLSCAHDSADKSSIEESTPADEVAVTNGEGAYNEHCAGCHETGLMGAPIAGDAADWGSRSNLWDAVLLDHAITGYFEMPAKGGRTDLPEEVVKSAAEYMLLMTFPDMPHDCNPPDCSDDL